MRKTIISSIFPPVIVALFACLSFYIVNTRIVKENVNSTVNAAIYQLTGDVQEILQPNMDKMSNWQAIVEEIHEENALFRVMKGIAADLSEDTLFYYATSASRFSEEGFFINNLGWEPDDTWDPSTRTWFKEAVANNGRFTYTEPYVDDRTGKVCTTFSQSVKDKNDKVLGVAAMDVMLDVLSDLVSRALTTPSVVFSVYSVPPTLRISIAPPPYVPDWLGTVSVAAPEPATLIDTFAAPAAS